MTLRVLALMVAVAMSVVDVPVNAQSNTLFTLHSNPWINLHYFLSRSIAPLGAGAR
jgi:hypothetical protein